MLAPLCKRRVVLLAHEAHHLLSTSDADAALAGELTPRSRALVAGLYDCGTYVGEVGFHATTLRLHGSTAT
jgi:hypothetical protein